MNIRENKGALITVIAVLLVIAAGGWFIVRFSKKAPVAKGGPICIVSGDMKNQRKEAKGFESLGNMVRLHFESANFEECKQSVSDYCHGRIIEGYTPGRLTLTYRTDPNGEVSEKYSISGHCVFDKIEEK